MRFGQSTTKNTRGNWNPTFRDRAAYLCKLTNRAVLLYSLFNRSHQRKHVAKWIKISTWNNSKMTGDDVRARQNVVLLLWFPQSRSRERFPIQQKYAVKKTRELKCVSNVWQVIMPYFFFKRRPFQLFAMKLGENF